MRCGAGCGGRVRGAGRTPNARRPKLRRSGPPAVDHQRRIKRGCPDRAVCPPDCRREATHTARGTPENRPFVVTAISCGQTHCRTRPRAGWAPGVGFTQAQHEKGPRADFGRKASPAPQRIRAITRGSLALSWGHGYIKAAFPRHCVAERPGRGRGVLSADRNLE
jgi:hypothetical protein